jgi:hypothetical protein
MPLVSTATSVVATATTSGQRISTLSYGRIPHSYYYDINISTSQFIINVLEDKIEPTFSLLDVALDFTPAPMANNIAIGQISLPTAQTNSILSVNAYTNWSTSSYVVIDDPDIPGGTTATAVLTISSGTVTGIVLTNPGSGYVHVPAVKAYDPLAPLPPGVTLAKQPAPQQLPGGVRVDLDNSTMTTATVTYLRGTLPMTIDEFKRRAVGLDHNTLWAFETNIVDIKDNIKPNWENAQSAGLDVQMVRFFDAFPYLGKTMAPTSFGKSTKLLQFGRLVNILNLQNVDPTPRLEVASYFDVLSQPFFWIFVHNKNFTNFNQCTWKFNHFINRFENVHPDLTITGASADDFAVSAADAVSALRARNNPVANHVPPSTNWTNYFETIYVQVQDEPVTAGTPVNFTVSTAAHIDYLYVTSVCGLPDRTKITLTNGTGTFNILTTTLTAGETAAAWLGFKHYPEIVECVKTLS